MVGSDFDEKVVFRARATVASQGSADPPAGGIAVPAVVVEKDDQCVLNHCTRFLARDAATWGDRTLATQHLHSALARTRAMNAPLLTSQLEERHDLLTA